MPRTRIPKLCHHRGRERGYVTVDGRELYFAGLWPRKQKHPPEAIQRQYDQWLARRLSGDTSRDPANHPLAHPDSITIDSLWARYFDFLPTEYTKHGVLTSEYHCIKSACRIVARLYGETLACEFGPLALRAVQQAFVAEGWERRYVNQQIDRVRRMFSWGVSQELVHESVWRALTHVGGLQRGKTAAPERRKVQPVDWQLVEKTLPFLTPTQDAMVRVHRLIGCRAAEVVQMRPCDLDRSGDVWVWTPPSHKTEHRDMASRYFVGPQAQAVLKPLLGTTPPDGWLFPTRRPGGVRRGRYSTGSYRNFIQKACKRAGLPKWSPGRIRHTRATEIRGMAWGGHTGLEAASAVIGHADPSTTAIYADRSDELARQVVRQIG